MTDEIKGTPRDARVIGNFGFKRTQMPVTPPIQERVIVSPAAELAVWLSPSWLFAGLPF